MNALNRRLVGVTAGLLMALCGSAGAQERKPLPPQPVQPPAGMERLPTFPEWLSSYQAAGTPRLLFYTDLMTTSRGDAKLLNDAATVTRLGGRIEQWFRAPEVLLLNPGAVSITTEEQRKTLRDNDEFAAATMIGRMAQADIIVFIRLIEQSGRKDGVLYTGTYIMADLRQGTSIDRHSWDMTPDPVSGELDATRMAQYAQVLADRITNTFMLQFPPNIAAPAAPVAPASPAPSPITVPDQGPGAAPGSAVVPQAPAVAPGSTPPSAPGAPVIAMPARRYTVRLAGEYEDQLIIGFRDALTGLARMRPGSLIERGLSAGDGGKTMTFEMMYAGGPIDLQNDLAAVAADRLEQDTSVLEAREGLVVIQLRPARVSARDRALVAGGDTYRNTVVRQQFREAYNAAGRPSFAVMVNAAADPGRTEEMLVPPAGPGELAKNPEMQGQPAIPAQVIVTPRIILGNSTETGGITADLTSAVRDEMARRERELRESRAVDTRTMEDSIYQKLIRLGVEARDLAAAQAAAGQGTRVEGQVLNEKDLAASLGGRAGADVIISGSGRIVRFGPDGYPSRLRYTFRAYRVSDGAVIAADSVEDDVDYTKPQWSRAIERLAEEAAGKMAGQMLDRWNSGQK
ncbi:MAG: hypothetical protein IT436_18290 [Phycisphaerales bacterium]|nr:hypothetical protein [Phycisphaerales bacterium]